MATQVQRRRGTTTEHSTFTGAEGELTVDTTKDTVVVHDGATAGGQPLAREDLDNVSSADVTAKVSAATTSAAGKVQLEDSTTSTSTTTAATPSSVKVAKDAADAAQATADAALPATGGTISSNLTVEGNLTVNGTTTTVDSETLLVKDKNIEMGVVDTPTDTTANGGGITLKGTTDKTINWVDSTDSWTSSENVDLASGKTYKIAGTDVLSATTLGSAVVNSSLTSVGNLTDLTVDTDTLVVDATNDRVGIGVASPAWKLDVANSANTLARFTKSSAGDAYVRISSHTGNIVGLQLGDDGDIDKQMIRADNTNNALIFNTANAEKVRIDSSGRLLVGTSSSTVAFRGIFQGNSAGTDPGAICIAFDSSTPANGNILGALDFSDNSHVRAARISCERDGGTWTSGSTGSQPSRLVFATTADGAASPTTRMTIKSDGTVGIGTTGPSRRLDVYESGTATIVGNFESNTTQCYITLHDTGTTANAVRIGSLGDDFAINTGGSQSFRIDSSGNVGIGTSSPVGDLHVVGKTGSAGRIYISDVDESTAATDSLLLTQSGVNSSIYNRNDTGGLFLGAGDASNHVSILAGGNVGIGTTSPDATLNVRAGDNNTDATEIVSFSRPDAAVRGAISKGLIGGTTNGIALGTTTNHPFALNTNGSERLYITNAGNVGINQTSPSNLLHVGSVVGDGIAIGSTVAGTITRETEGLRLTATSTTRNISFVTSGTEAARIDTSGRLLVGTSTARSDFDAGGTALTPKIQVEGTTTSNSSLSVVGNNAAARLFLGRSAGTAIGDADLVANGTLLGEIKFNGADGANLIEAASIAAYTDSGTGTNDMPGRLVFEVTANGASSPTERVRLEEDGQLNLYTNTNLVVRSVRTSGLESAFVVQSAATGTLAGTTELVVYADGDVENTNNRYTQLSDERFKENIVDANSQWDDIKAVRVRNFNFKEETGRNTHTQLGVVAQEIELTSPGLVIERKDPDTDETHKSVAYSVLYMKAVKALQEAMERIETLEAKVAALEGN